MSDLEIKILSLIRYIVFLFSSQHKHILLQLSNYNFLSQVHCLENKSCSTVIRILVLKIDQIQGIVASLAFRRRKDTPWFCIRFLDLCSPFDIRFDGNRKSSFRRGKHEFLAICKHRKLRSYDLLRCARNSGYCYRKE